MGSAHVQEGAKPKKCALPAPERRQAESLEDCHVNIEVLYVLDCPHYPAALAELKSVLAVENISAPISEVLVANPRMAEALKFRGSPTIRINGRDIAGDSGLQQFALSCRFYPGEEQPGVPPPEMIHRAVREAMRGEKQ
jgi:hypothetical protein